MVSFVKKKKEKITDSPYDELFLKHLRARKCTRMVERFFFFVKFKDFWNGQIVMGDQPELKNMENGLIVMGDLPQ
jgi:hypothetical protein